MREDIFDCIIVGAGISGISSSLELINRGKKVLIIEQASDWEKRTITNINDISCGFGGAGLFCDGKLSFMPAATYLWTLNEKYLSYSKSRAISILKDSGVKLISTDDNHSRNQEKLDNQKYYETKILNKEERNEIVKYLRRIIGDNVQFNTKIIKISHDNENDLISVYCIENDNRKNEYQCKTILYAGGKNGGYEIRNIIDDIEYEFINYEVGLRLETDSVSFDLYENSQKDCKIIETIDNIELRTFCCCRDGIIMESKVNGTTYFNGNSDVITNKSNIGINVRISNKEYAYLLDKFFKEVDIGKINYKKFDIKTYLLDNSYIIDDIIDRKIKTFLKKYFPKALNADSTTIQGPSIEHYGNYPKVDKNLKILEYPIWLAGDCVGRFRGILPAFISGIFAACAINDYLEKYAIIDNNIENFNIKESSIENIDIIFTAQSKKFFYCRDAICEYVFKVGKLPINPFRIFDYFLNDRVKRSIIRQSNNKLIELANELWVFGLIADGVLFEIYYAKKLGKKIRFFSIDSLASNIKEISVEEIKFEPEVHSQQITRTSLINFIKFGSFETNQKEFIF